MWLPADCCTCGEACTRRCPGAPIPSATRLIPICWPAALSAGRILVTVRKKDERFLSHSPPPTGALLAPSLESPGSRNMTRIRAARQRSCPYVSRAGIRADLQVAAYSREPTARPVPTQLGGGGAGTAACTENGGVKNATTSATTLDNCGLKSPPIEVLDAPAQHCGDRTPEEVSRRVPMRARKMVTAVRLGVTVATKRTVLAYTMRTLGSLALTTTTVPRSGVLQQHRPRKGNGTGQCASPRAFSRRDCAQSQATLVRCQSGREQLGSLPCHMDQQWPLSARSNAPLLQDWRNCREL